MKKIIIIAMLVLSTASWAELPSWGMTEDQYKLPNFDTKMDEIGEQAAKNTWLLKITAPKGWHNTIRTGLTDSGARDVQINFKDSLYPSMTISAAKGIKLASVSTTESSEPVQKQVMIDKPDIDTNIEAPVFEKIDIQNNTEALLENMDLSLPASVKPAQATKPTTKPTVKAAEVKAAEVKATEVKAAEVKAAEVKATEVKAAEVKPATVTEATPVEPVVVKPEVPVTTTTPTIKTEVVVSNEKNIEENKEDLRDKYARTKRVDRNIGYDNLNDKDELFIQGDVVLVKRFVNRGVAIYYWMSESYNPSVHKLVEKGSGKFQKDPSALVGDNNKNQESEKPEVIAVTNLDFIAVNTDKADQDVLRRDYIRNKVVDVSITVDQLKKGDILYVLNQSVMVERPITIAQSAYFWLVGDTTIALEVERKSDNRFEIK